MTGIIKPLNTTALLPTSSGSATTLNNAKLIHVYPVGTVLGGGTTQDQDGITINIVSTQGQAPIASIRVALQETLVIEKNPAHFIYADGNVFATSIAYRN